MDLALEITVAALLLALALFPLAALVRRRSAHGGLTRVALLYIAAFAAVGGGAAILIARGLPGPDPPPDRPYEASFDGYVSSRTCRACHPSQYASWHASYHRTMTQVATPETILADVDGVELARGRWRYRVDRRGDEIWVGIEDTRWRPGMPGARKREKRLVLMTGSHHDQMYWLASPERGRALQQFAFSYSRRLERWIPVESSFLSPPRIGNASNDGHWNQYCSPCHTTRPELRGTNWRPPYENASLDTRVAEFGIACESCHGPAAAHVRENRSPIRRYELLLGEEGDPTIVHPKRLDSRRSSAVCGQCHGIFIREQDDRFQPGMDIDAIWTFIQLRYLSPDYRPETVLDQRRQRDIRRFVRSEPRLVPTSYWGDGQVRVSGREYNGLIESPCYERGEITCLSCHTLHKPGDDPRSLREWSNDQLTAGMEGNTACLQCHPDFGGEALPKHTRHEADSAGSLCYNCHMPFTSYGIQKAHRSHLIASPSVDESLATGRPNACNQCHLDRSLGWVADQLQRDYGLPGPSLTPEQREVAAGVQWSLRGDAGQRALMAWSMGWRDAREASGALASPDWMVPYLAQLLDDPYDSVRFIAWLSLRQREGFDALDYDFVGSEEARRAASQQAMQTHGLRHDTGATGDGAAVLLDGAGNLRRERFDALLQRRDDRPITLRE